MTTFSARRHACLGAAIAASMGIGYGRRRRSPHMTASIALLQSARGETRRGGRRNKGGHRERALGLIDQAISKSAPALRLPES